MKNTTKWLLLAALFIAALVSYGIGFSQSAIAFIVMGVLLELSFWFGLFRHTSHHDNHQGH